MTARRAFILVAFLAAMGVAVGCGGNDLDVGEPCTDHTECASGYCNLESGGSGECDTNDFGLPCSQNSDCDGLCQANGSSSADAAGYCTRRCDNVRDCSAEPDYTCSSLGPGSPEICRQE